MVPTVLSAVGVPGSSGRFHLITIRSNDQFNTTIYGMDDRLRGINGSRTVLLINRDDMKRQGLSEGEFVALVGDSGDDVRPRLQG